MFLDSPEPTAEVGYWDEILAALYARSPRERRGVWRRVERAPHPEGVEWRAWISERLRYELSLCDRPNFGPGANRVERACLVCGETIRPTGKSGSPRLRHPECGGRAPSTRMAIDHPG